MRDHVEIVLHLLGPGVRWFRGKVREFRYICRPYRYDAQMDWLRTYLDTDRFMLVDREVHML